MIAVNPIEKIEQQRKLLKRYTEGCLGCHSAIDDLCHIAIQAALAQADAKEGKP